MAIKSCVFQEEALYWTFAKRLSDLVMTLLYNPLKILPKLVEFRLPFPFSLILLCGYLHCDLWKWKRTVQNLWHQTQHYATFFYLTHWGPDKMACISRTSLTNQFLWMKILEFWLKFQWTLSIKGPINDILALVHIMAWCRKGDKSLSEPRMDKVYDTYIRHSASMN